MKILIENLCFDTVIGILDHERLTPQPVIIDCTIDYAYDPGSFINYAEVALHIEKTLIREQFFLIEDALEYLSRSLKEDFPLMETLHLTLKKPSILQNCTVGVQKSFIF